jgi:copper chaperone CopZ
MLTKTKFLAVLMSILISTVLQAQISEVTVGINGLTCSMCSRTVEKSMLRLQWVEKVEMSLETTEAKIFIKKNAAVSMKEFPRSVKDAGFSVRFVSMEINAAGLRVQEDGLFYASGQQFRFTGTNKIPKEGIIKFRLIDPLFTRPNESKKWAALLPQKTENNVLHVVIE